MPWNVIASEDSEQVWFSREGIIVTGEIPSETDESRDVHWRTLQNPEANEFKLL